MYIGTNSMKSVDLFDFPSYRPYLIEKTKEITGRERGTRMRMAAILGCQTAYISRILAGQANLSLEQGLLLSSFFKLDALEQDYFLLLIQVERAGSASLTTYYKEKLDELRVRQLELRVRSHPQKELSDQDKMKYYSSWFYSAIHILSASPDVKSPLQFSRYLELSIETVQRALKFLVQIGLVIEQKNGYVYNGEQSIFLGRNSDMISTHHFNWRKKALMNLDSPKPLDIHFSSVTIISEDCARNVASLIVEDIKKYRSLFHASESKDLYCLNYDFFRLKP